MAVRGVPPLRVAHNTLFGGGPHSTPVGTTKNKNSPVNAPVRRRVVLLDALTFQPIREMWSDATNGEWQFHGIRGGTFYVTAFDHTGTYAPVAEGPFEVPAP